MHYSEHARSMHTSRHHGEKYIKAFNLESSVTREALSLPLPRDASSTYNTLNLEGGSAEEASKALRGLEHTS